MKATFTYKNFDFWFRDSDVVFLNDFIPAGSFNPYNVRPWLLHDHGTPIAVVFASDSQEALDIAADAGKLDSLLISPSAIDNYDEKEEGITRLGNACKPFDIERLDLFPLPPVRFSFAAMFMAEMKEEGGFV